MQSEAKRFVNELHQSLLDKAGTHYQENCERAKYMTGTDPFIESHWCILLL